MHEAVRQLWWVAPPIAASAHNDRWIIFFPIEQRIARRHAPRSDEDIDCLHAGLVVASVSHSIFVTSEEDCTEVPKFDDEGVHHDLNAEPMPRFVMN